MREIKFRIWNDYDKNMINWNEMCEQNLPNIFRIPSYSKYLMQYTGLHDKNEKEIYEGDIIEITRPCVYETGKIIFKNGCFFVKVKETLLALWECKPNNYELKVIGNIYDNPELLEV